MKILILILISFGSVNLNAQSVVTYFDIVLNDKTIGVLKASKHTNGKQTTKNISSNSKTNVFSVSVHVESEIYVISENEILKTSFAYRQANRGSENLETKVKYIASSKYEIVKNGQKISLNRPIGYCVADLYFKEPKGLNSVFSNTHGEFLIIKPLGKSEYELNLPDGKSNIFKYLNGKLIQVETKMIVGKVIFIRK